MVVNKIGVFKDFNDNSLKSVFDLGKDKIIEMVLLNNNQEMDMISVPTHYWCNIGCDGCDLCSFTEKNMSKINVKEFIECLISSLLKQNSDVKRTDKTNLQIIFDGVGDCLLNIDLVEQLFLNEKYIKSKLGYKKITYVITTVIPNNKMNQLTKVVNDLSIPVKIEFLIKNSNELESKLKCLQEYQKIIKENKIVKKKNSECYGRNELIEIVYPLINDTKEEIIGFCEFIESYNFPIKFLNVSKDRKIEQKYKIIVNNIAKQNTKLNVRLQNLGALEVGNTCKNYSKHYFHYDFVSDEEKRKFELWKVKHRVYEQQRSNYLCWDEYFMAIAKLTAMRSKDPNTQVGACIVGDDNRILSIGYNGSPNGYKDECFIWEREGKPLDTKYMYVVHAERNAILNYRGSRRDFENAKIYVDLFPCNECAKEIIQAGIKEVIYLSDKYAKTDSTIASKRLFDACGVKYRQLDENNCEKIVLNLDVEN